MKHSGKYTGHDRRVTLHLAYLSNVCSQNQELIQALEVAREDNFKLDNLEQKHLETIYAEFDDELEEKVRSEFIADPSYLNDLGHAQGVCPLCGHKGCRFIFKLENTAGGQEIECGSECIITYGLSVKGAETAEQAKKALETAIRQQIKKIKIKEWNELFNFGLNKLDVLENALYGIRFPYSINGTIPYPIRAKAKKLENALYKQQEFYSGHGWLTEKRWAIYRKIFKFVKEYHPDFHDKPLPKAWEEIKPPQPKKKKELVFYGPVQQVEEDVQEIPAPVIPAPVVPVLEQSEQGQLSFDFAKGM